MIGYWNKDILNEVFQHLSGDQSSPALKLNFALTCKAFCDWALQELWREMTSIGPLLSLLRLEDGTLGSLIEMDRERRSRFDVYRKMVEQFFWNQDPDVDEVEVDPSCLLFLCAAPLFPSLRTLQIYNWMPSALLYLLVSNTIEDLVILDLVVNSHILACFLSALAKNTNTSRLRNLDCGWCPISTHTLTRCIPCFVNLQTLDMDQSDSFQALLPNILLMNSLISLTAELPRGFSVDSSLPSLFPLEVLLLRGQLLSITAFLDYFDLSSLEHLDIQTRDDENLTLVINRLYRHFVERPPLSLHAVDISVRMGNLNHEVFFGFLEFVRPLLRLCAIRRFAFYTNHTISIENSHFEQVATAWPDVEILTIRASFQAKPSFTTLEIFAKLWPHLSYLAIPIDTSNLSTDYKPSRTCHPLHKLIVYNSKVESPVKAVATQLFSLFPSLDILEAVVKDSSEAERQWHQVFCAFDALRFVFRSNEDYDEREVIIPVKSYGPA